MFDPEEEPQAAAVTNVGGSVINGAPSRAVIRISGSVVGDETLAAEPVARVTAARFLILPGCQAVANSRQRGLDYHTRLFMRKIRYETA